MTEELARELPGIGSPESMPAPVSAKARARVASSLRDVEAGLAELELLHEQALVRERDWIRRAELAAEQARSDLVDQARRFAMQAAEDAISYAKEMAAARDLLKGWSGSLG